MLWKTLLVGASHGQGHSGRQFWQCVTKLNISLSCYLSNVPWYLPRRVKKISTSPPNYTDLFSSFFPGPSFFQSIHRCFFRKGCLAHWKLHPVFFGGCFYFKARVDRLSNIEHLSYKMTWELLDGGKPVWYINDTSVWPHTSRIHSVQPGVPFTSCTVEGLGVQALNAQIFYLKKQYPVHSLY